MIDVSPKQSLSDQYIGDGVYASFDGFQIKLWTERENGTHIIYLEPDTYRNLLNFANGLLAVAKAAVSKASPGGGPW